MTMLKYTHPPQVKHYLTIDNLLSLPQKKGDLRWTQFQRGRCPPVVAPQTRHHPAPRIPARAIQAIVKQVRHPPIVIDSRRRGWGRSMWGDPRHSGHVTRRGVFVDTLWKLFTVKDFSYWSMRMDECLDNSYSMIDIHR